VKDAGSQRKRAFKKEDLRELAGRVDHIRAFANSVSDKASRLERADPATCLEAQGVWGQ
jgi:hypothetical protein